MLQLASDIRERAAGKKIAIMGVGTFCTLNMRFLIELGLDICFFVDVDYCNRRYFEYQTGFKVKPYEALNPREHFPFIYQNNYLVVDSIENQLQKMDFKSRTIWPFPKWRTGIYGTGA